MSEPEELLEGFLERLGGSASTEAISDLFKILLSRPELIETEGVRVPFSLNFGGTDKTELTLDSVAFGILFEQEKPSKGNEHSPSIVAPFGYYSIEEVVRSQDNPKIKQSYRFLWNNASDWSMDSFKEELQDETGVSHSTASAIILGSIFGTYIEAAKIENVKIDEEVAEEIVDKYKD